ncbi:MAG: hypothetical protein L0Y58_12785 [Verrucomicrobia subdivision 3 bacterium]|nr:hypothetical protein [Limisphaerales bacterium]
MSIRLWLHVCGGLSAAAWAALAVISPHASEPLIPFLLANASAWLLFGVSWWLCRQAEKEVSRIVVLWGVAFRLCGFIAQPVLDDDYFRYLWDGRQLGTGANPYATAPADHFAGDVGEFEEILNNVSYPHVRTIYGPLTEVGFALSYWIAPGKLWPWKLFVISCDLLLLWLIACLTQTATPLIRRTALLLVAWCPLSIFETGFNAHADVLGVTLLIAAMFGVRASAGVLNGRLRARQGWVTMSESKRQHIGAVLCGLAVSAKVFAVLLVPLLLERRFRSWLMFALVVAAMYLPFVFTGTSADLQGLLTFAASWEFNSSLYAVLSNFTGVLAAKFVLGGVFLTVCFAVWLQWRRDRSLPRGDILYGALFLCAATVNPWYLLWMLPFVALRPSVAGLTALAAVSASYITWFNLGVATGGAFEHPIWVRPIEYGAVLAGAGIDLWRWRRSKAVISTRA